MKKCPFCGASNITISYDYGDYAVCQSCGANGPHKIMATERAAISSWNQRKEDKVCVPECFIRPDGQGQRNMMEVAGQAKAAIAKAEGNHE